MELKEISIEDLNLDLSNYRAIPQTTEKDAVDTILSISPDNFWALFESIIEKGYSGTENIIVLDNEKNKIVMEGNRRIAVLKLIYGLVPDFPLEKFYVDQIASLSKEWKTKNSKIPCAVYSAKEIGTVRNLISLIHAKGEKARREEWKSIAKARFGRDIKNQKEYGLDLFDKYLATASDISDSLKKKWSGTFEITILDEALQQIVKKLNLKSVKELVDSYPQSHKELFNNLIFSIGNGIIGYKEIRDQSFLTNDQFSEFLDDQSDLLNTRDPIERKEIKDPLISNPKDDKSKISKKLKPKTHALEDQKSVKKILRSFIPRGTANQKVVSLLNEMKLLNIESQPLSFCFLTRSMIEISLKAFSEDPVNMNPFKTFDYNNKGKVIDHKLKDIINDACTYFEKKDAANIKKLQGAKTELNGSATILSVTSMNQIVHNPNFSLRSTDICKAFHNIFPLIELLNS
jgi:Ca2+-binding EF-hand superfamily protein